MALGTLPSSEHSHWAGIVEFIGRLPVVLVVMEDRRGPEYVSASVVSARRERSRRRFLWAIPPVVGVVLAGLTFQLWVPMRSAAGRINRMVELVGKQKVFHAIEYRPWREREEVLRQDFVHDQLRRTELFNREVVFLSLGNGNDSVLELAPYALRRHRGSSVTNAAPIRLMTDCIDPGASIRVGPKETVSVEVNDRRHEIVLASDGLPSSWTTFFRTDRGLEILTRTTVEWGKVDLSAFEWDLRMESAIPVDERRQTPFGPHARPIQKVGEVTLLGADINSVGDLILAYRSPFDRIYLEVTDQFGVRYTSQQAYPQSPRSGRFYTNETTAYRLVGQSVWPIKLTVKIWEFDPRLEVGGEPKLLGTWAHTFTKATCSFAPHHWFDPYMSDRPYYNYLTRRSFARSIAYKNAMRDSEQRFVEIINSRSFASADLSQLRRESRDHAASIREMRNCTRLWAEFDPAVIPFRQYVALAQILRDADLKEEARRTVEHIQSMARNRQVDTSVLVDTENLRKELDR